jgi:hypothetical protein
MEKKRREKGSKNIQVRNLALAYLSQLLEEN